jgi:hypothetical protein
MIVLFFHSVITSHILTKARTNFMINLESTTEYCTSATHGLELCLGQLVHDRDKLLHEDRYLENAF